MFDPSSGRINGAVGSMSSMVARLLAHLSRRLIHVGELIVYACTWHPSVVYDCFSEAVSPILFIFRIYSIYRLGERTFVFLFQSDKNSGCYGN